MKEVDFFQQIVRSLLTGQLKAAADPHRPRWHLAAPVGLLNDPNGFIEHGGRYHLFYQWNPLGCTHSNKGWGHVSSTDLLHWQHEPIALLPTEAYESHGCYSGSAVSDEQGRLTLIYTGNVKYPDGSRTAFQCLARADGESGFDKLGPVLDLPEGYSGHVRDPKVWHDGQQWLMVLGARTLDDKGEVLLYRGESLQSWQLRGPIAGSGRGGLGEFGYMWECPDLFPLADRHVLISCPQGIAPQGEDYRNLYQCGWLAGQFDGEHFEHEAFHELDRGFEFYAPQTTLDSQGRRLLFGWLGLPEENEMSQPTIPYGWIHQMSCPRELFWQHEWLCQRPVAELAALKGELTRFEGVVSEFPGMTIDSAWLDLTLTGAGSLWLGTVAELVWQKGRIGLRRQNWQSGEWEERSTPWLGGPLTLLCDRSSLECFVDDGRQTLSARYFPGEKPQLSAGDAGEGGKICLNHWPLSACLVQ
ncbi:TPA: sucrose-6-phosphate hydrolase [Aeromonas salmonicida]|uniref:glycoside hydrolase family 32 protein n=1 Tax=Aeromonas salmonicida TaxID=645 RepID=UPI0002DF5346|nr:sucrose-6-phosphate hydrolase [Aeromonas salmonicida]ASI22578.1 glycosyl hydrolase family 32 [Aeromonas salmonicida]ASI26893.1 glycosyl hydrolase family 32 [Aeromonas salmonicida]ASI31011.1 glycosyl hydrolase family 32 [Aeromonas salmonicida]ATD40429.1 glycosyl hydrolase family 32 [Aeromonas salmonicida subsp. masoucida]ELI6405681.1 sucrose-6-phosphate hydrolase [Aeromonas salmonicida subsp. salmonicida]